MNEMNLIIEKLLEGVKEETLKRQSSELEKKIEFNEQFVSEHQRLMNNNNCSCDLMTKLHYETIELKRDKATIEEQLRQIEYNRKMNVWIKGIEK